MSEERNRYAETEEGISNIIQTFRKGLEGFSKEVVDGFQEPGAEERFEECIKHLEDEFIVLGVKKVLCEAAHLYTHLIFYGDFDHALEKKVLEGITSRSFYAEALEELRIERRYEANTRSRHRVLYSAPYERRYKENENRNGKNDD